MMIGFFQILMMVFAWIAGVVGKTAIAMPLAAVAEHLIEAGVQSTAKFDVDARSIWRKVFGLKIRKRYAYVLP